MNYVDLSRIYPVRDVAYVFCEGNVNPLGLFILDSNWRPYSNFSAFRKVGGWEWAGQSLRFFFVDVDFGI